MVHIKEGDKISRYTPILLDYLLIFFVWISFPNEIKFFTLFNGLPCQMHVIPVEILAIPKENPLLWKGNPLNSVNKSISLGKEIHKKISLGSQVGYVYI